MSDYIDRNLAIKAMDELEQDDIEAYGCKIPEGFDGERARLALCLIPLADVRENIKGEWIPVTERLPEDGQLILASYPDFVGGCMITKYNKVSNQSFLAWMPLPVPYDERLEQNIQAYMRDFKVSREQAIKDLTVPESNLDDIPTNLDEIRDMSAEELGQLLEDLTHYDDTDYEWKSNLMPLLPFEDWTDWLNRRAIYKKEV